MKRRHFIRTGALFVPAIFIPRLIRAQTPLTADGLATLASSPPSGGGGGGATQFITSLSGTLPTGSGITWKAGFKFQPSVAMTVTSLGRIRVGSTAHAHTIRMWDAGTDGSACGTELASVSVDISTVSIGAWAFATITGVSLSTTNQYYVFSDETNDGDLYYDDSAGHVTANITADASMIGSAYYDSSCHLTTSGGHAHGVPNFLYTKP